MFAGTTLYILHQITSVLLEPVIWALLVFLALALYEIGRAVGEKAGGITRLKAQGRKALMREGKRRIERADFITRLSPMLGLMGTLIPLGPGLSALGEGDMQVLTTAMIAAFDTTVVGLLAGMVGFVLGRLRRRWYDAALESLAEKESVNG